MTRKQAALFALFLFVWFTFGLGVSALVCFGQLRQVERKPVTFGTGFGAPAVVECAADVMPCSMPLPKVPESNFGVIGGAVILVHWQNGCGTGSIVAHDGKGAFALTCAHVLQDRGGRQAVTRANLIGNRGAVPADVVFYDANIDVALLYQPRAQKSTAALPLLGREIALGEMVDVYGRGGPHSYLKKTSGKRVPYGQFAFCVDATMTSGDSGAPMLADNAIAGVAFGGTGHNGTFTSYRTKEGGLERWENTYPASSKVTGPQLVQLLSPVFAQHGCTPQVYYPNGSSQGCPDGNCPIEQPRLETASAQPVPDSMPSELRLTEPVEMQELQTQTAQQCGPTQITVTMTPRDREEIAKIIFERFGEQLRGNDGTDGKDGSNGVDGLNGKDAEPVDVDSIVALVVDKVRSQVNVTVSPSDKSELIAKITSDVLAKCLEKCTGCECDKQAFKGCNCSVQGSSDDGCKCKRCECAKDDTGKPDPPPQPKPGDGDPVYFKLRKLTR